MPDAFFDIVIVGTNISGLAYGALCAKQGYTVLVVGQDARPATYTAGDATMFRTNPLFYGFASSGVLHSFFRDIGMLAEMRNRPTKVDPLLQVVVPGARFDLSERPQATMEELERVFPGSAREIEQFLRAATRDAKEMDDFLEGLPPLPVSGFFARRRLRRYVEKSTVYADAMQPLAFPAELRFASPLTSQLLFLSRLHTRPLSPFAVRRLLQHLAGGFFEFPQGIDGMKRLLTDRILANGGAYWPERSVDQIVLKGRKQVESVVVHRPRRSVGVRMLVGNCSPRLFFSLVPQEQQNPQFHGLIKALQPAWYNYVVNFAVQPDLIPSSLARNVLLSLYPKQETGGPNVLWLHTRMPEGYEAETPATLVVTTRIEAKDLPLEQSQFAALNERITQALEWVLPFLREKLIKIHTPYVALDRDTGEERLDPGEVQELYDLPFDGCLELSAIPCQTCYKNVLMLGDHYLGGLGLEGSILGARQAFAWTQDKVILKQILRK
jgi:hypothetical protein